MATQFYTLCVKRIYSNIFNMTEFVLANLGATVTNRNREIRGREVGAALTLLKGAVKILA
jgi:hypothetical protein